MFVTSLHADFGQEVPNVRKIVSNRFLKKLANNKHQKRVN